MKLYYYVIAGVLLYFAQCYCLPGNTGSIANSAFHKELVKAVREDEKSGRTLLREAIALTKPLDEVIAGLSGNDKVESDKAKKGQEKNPSLLSLLFATPSESELTVIFPKETVESSNQNDEDALYEKPTRLPNRQGRKYQMDKKWRQSQAVRLQVIAKELKQRREAKQQAIDNSKAANWDDMEKMWHHTFCE